MSEGHPGTGPGRKRKRDRRTRRRRRPTSGKAHLEERREKEKTRREGARTRVVRTPPPSPPPRRDGRPGMYPRQRRHNDVLFCVPVHTRSVRACVLGRTMRAWRRRGAPPHTGGREAVRTREWQRQRRRRRRQNDVKDARVARGGGVADRRKKKRRTVKERRGERQGEANGRSKQVEAVERGRASVSAVHLVHSCSLRRAAGLRVSGRRREIATDADGRTNERTDGRGRRGRGWRHPRGQEGEGSECERRENSATRHATLDRRT